MKRRAFGFIAAALCLAALVFASKHQSRLTNVKRRTASTPAAQIATSESASSSASSLSPPPIALNGPKSEGSPSFATGDAKQKQAGATDTELLAVKGMLRDYRAMMGQNPIGNNAEITKALLGGNPRGAQFNSSQIKLDKDGQLVDRWNHPYFFHQLSGTEMEVRSAGPDGVMWTPDDEVSP